MSQLDLNAWYCTLYKNFIYIIMFTVKEIFQIVSVLSLPQGVDKCKFVVFLLWLALNVVNCTGLYSIDHSLINIYWTDQLAGGAGTIGKTKL